MNEQCNERVAKALGRIPSGCAVVTARAGQKRTGLLASWIQQAAFEPPMISVAIKKGRPIEKLIDESGAMAVNLLGGDYAAMFKHFAKGFNLEQDAFQDIRHQEVTGGVAIDPRIALLNCRIHGKHDAGDHWVYLAVVSAAEIDEVKEPYVHLRKTGAAY